MKQLLKSLELKDTGNRTNSFNSIVFKILQLVMMKVLRTQFSQVFQSLLNFKHTL